MMVFFFFFGGGPHKNSMNIVNAINLLRKKLRSMVVGPW